MRSVFFLSTFKRASVGKRLWLAGGILAAFLLTLVIGNSFIARDRSVTRQMLGHDFLAFYTAGSFVRQGRAGELYNLDSVRDFEQSTAKAAGLEVGKSFGPWWNPPFYALIFEPLAGLPYATALDTWRWISVAAVAIAITLLTRQVGSASGSWQWKHAGLVPLLVLISMPFVQALSHGQNTFISLLLLTVTVLAWRNEKRFLAGLAGGLLFYKPQLGAVVAAAMVVDLGWESLGGLCVTGTILLATTLIAMPGSLTDWLHQLPANVRWMQVEHAYLWERHVTFKSFWRLLLQGREAGEATLLTTATTYLSVGIISAGLLVAAIRLRRSEHDGHREWKGLYRDRFITATITAMPLLMPFYFDYDLLLLAVPLSLYAMERISGPPSKPSIDSRVTLAWTMLFAWMYFNPAIALHTHVSGTVILLSTTAALSIQRAIRRQAQDGPILLLHPQPLAMAA